MVAQRPSRCAQNGQEVEPGICRLQGLVTAQSRQKSEAGSSIYARLKNSGLDGVEKDMVFRPCIIVVAIFIYAERHRQVEVSIVR